MAIKKKQSEKNYNNTKGLKYKICVSGAADTSHCAVDACEKAETIGREVAKRGMILMTGATTGTPYWAAKGAKAEGGMVIGLSPASSKVAHLKTYQLPIDHHDMIIYTGFEYSGRNLMLTRSSDAVVVVCGRIGTLNEFTIAFEDQKPIGVLEGTGGTVDMIREILAKANRGHKNVIFSKNPKELMDELVELIKVNDKKNGIK